MKLRQNSWEYCIGIGVSFFNRLKGQMIQLYLKLHKEFVYILVTTMLLEPFWLLPE